jgi:hypothetical protein
MISNFRFRYNPSFVKDEISKDEQKIINEEVEKIINMQRRQINEKYYNKLSAVIYGNFHFFSSSFIFGKNVRPLFNDTDHNVKKLDSILQNKGLRFPYDNIDLYLSLKDVQLEIKKIKDEIKLRNKIRSKINTKLINEALDNYEVEREKERKELFRLYEIERRIKK